MSRVQTCPGFILLKNLFIKNKAYIQTPTTKHWLPVWRLRDWPNSGKNKQFLLIYSRCWQPLVFHIVSISACLSLILAFYKPLCSLHYIFSLFLSHQPNTPWNQNNHWMPNVNVKCHRKIISCFINGLRITETVQSEALNKDPNISTKFCWLYVMYVGTWHWHYIPIPAGTVHFPTFWPSLLIFTNCLLVFTGDLFRSGLTQM